MKQDDSMMMNKEGFESYMKSKAFAKSTIEHGLIMIGIYFKWLKLENLEAAQVNYNDLLGFMKYCQRGKRSQRTIQHYMITVRHFYDHLIREKQIITNPAKDISVKGAKRKVLYYILEPHQLNALYNQYPVETLQQKRDKILLGLLVYQGIRTEELDKLTINNIKLKEGKIDILGGIRRNGRMLQLEAHQVLEMYDYILQVRPELVKMKPKRKYQTQTESDLLFIGEGGHRYSINNFVTRTMVRARKINSNVLNAKQIRASVITKWLKIYNLREVQYLAGHRYIGSTESFLQNDLEGLQEEINQYQPLG
jgi:site-specific recombinase XerD